mmetsp:Transcript_38824/g.44421  ORF Transcript_38824/g.44421 Transcript_38824/m.44421 type:complete len:92 (-) Transcript_38824:191-466(-)
MQVEVEMTQLWADAEEVKTEEINVAEEAEERCSANQQELMQSKLKGIDFNFTNFISTCKAIKTLSYIPYLKHIKIQSIDNQLFVKTLLTTL